MTLENAAYRRAMANAQQNRSQDQFEAAAQDLEAALAAQPADPTATRLLAEMRVQGRQARAKDLARKGDFAGAVNALEAGLKEASSETETGELLAKFRNAKVEADRQLAESRLRELVSGAKALAEERNFEPALARLAEARKISPERAELAELETAYREAGAKHAAEVAAQKRDAEFSRRSHKFQEDWNRMMAQDKDASLFVETRWKTAKPAGEVRAALTRLRSENRRYTFMGLGPSTPEYFTAEMKSSFGIRIGAVTYEEGNTQILLKLIEYSGGPANDNRRNHNEAYRRISIGSGLRTWC